MRVMANTWKPSFSFSGVHGCLHLQGTHVLLLFAVFNTYHLLLLQGKTSHKDYYLSISCHTDNIGLNPPKACNHIASEYPRLILQRIGILNFSAVSRYGNI